MTRFRLASWNMRKALGTDRRRDPDRVLRVIDRLEADIVLLQEADRRRPPRRPVLDPAEVLRRTGLRAIDFDHGRESLGWHGNAMLVRPDIVVERFAHHDLPGLEPRGCVEAVLARDGARLRVFGTHLGLLRNNRRAQLAALLRLIGPEGGPPVALAGDFNERSLEIGLGRLVPRFTLLDTGRSFHARMPVWPLDRIATSRGVACLRAGVAAVAETDRASDHLPVFAELRLGRDGAGD